MRVDVSEFDLSIRDISARGMPVDAAMPDMLILRAISICFAATLRTAASRNIECNS
jgi:hypothetical protein